MTLNFTLICVTFVDFIIYPKALRHKFIRIVEILLKCV